MITQEEYWMVAFVLLMGLLLGHVAPLEVK